MRTGSTAQSQAEHIKSVRRRVKRVERAFFGTVSADRESRSNSQKVCQTAICQMAPPSLLPTSTTTYITATSDPFVFLTNHSALASLLSLQTPSPPPPPPPTAARTCNMPESSRTQLPFSAVQRIIVIDDDDDVDMTANGAILLILHLITLRQPPSII